MRAKSGTVALERALSKLGLASRTEARRLITGGHVTVNGCQANDPAQLVIPEQIRVVIDGRAQSAKQRVTIALHKPRGVVTTKRDPEGRPTVYDLVAGVGTHVTPVGRLDYATSGLLLLTNDTRLADYCTDPENNVPRIYLVTVRGRVTPDKAAVIEKGFQERGELLQARSVTIRKASNRESHLVVELVEGKNREIRRMLSTIGHEVVQLRRVQIGGLTIGDLPPGAWRRVDDDEIARAFPGAPPRSTTLRPRRQAGRVGRVGRGTAGPVGSGEPSAQS